jgi:hypothetical protein
MKDPKADLLGPLWTLEEGQLGHGDRAPSVDRESKSDTGHRKRRVSSKERIGSSAKKSRNTEDSLAKKSTEVIDLDTSDTEMAPRIPKIRNKRVDAHDPAKSAASDVANSDEEETPAPSQRRKLIRHPKSADDAEDELKFGADYHEESAEETSD